MIRTRCLTVLGALLSFALLPSFAAAGGLVGQKAPTVEPSEWINAKGAVNWQSLRGRLILVEKWATWCGPCRESIPHLIKLHDEYGKKGLVIIGVSDEAAGTIKPFVEKMNMNYLVAVGGAPEYKTDGIPHAWLVNPKGEVVWDDHPMNLKNELIEENLKGVRLTPEFKLPKELKSTQALLDAGKYAQAMKELEKSSSNTKASAEVTKAATETLEQVKKYGDDKLAEANELAKDKFYIDAIQLLGTLDKGFSGHEIGNKAKARKSELTGSPEVKLELAASQELDKAKDLIKQKKYKPAATILRGITESKKLKDTKARDLAEKALQGIRDKI